MIVSDARAFATLVTFEVDVEIDDVVYTYIGEWEFGKEHFYHINDDYGNEVDFTDPITDKIRDFAKQYIAENAEDIRLDRDY